MDIGPVEPLGAGVERQPVRPVDVRADDDGARRRVAVHAGALDLRRLAPVAPVHVPAARGTESEWKSVSLDRIRR